MKILLKTWEHSEVLSLNSKRKKIKKFFYLNKNLLTET